MKQLYTENFFCQILEDFFLGSNLTHHIPKNTETYFLNIQCQILEDFLI